MELTFPIKIVFLTAYAILVAVYMVILYAVLRAAKRIEVPLPELWVYIIVLNSVLMLIGIVFVLFTNP